jgi:hypothetical protein
VDGHFLPGLKLSGGRDGGLGLACGAVLGRLSVGQPYGRKWPFVARSYGRCCVYGPNYVKLSRVGDGGSITESAQHAVGVEAEAEAVAHAHPHAAHGARGGRWQAAHRRAAALLIVWPSTKGLL